MKRKFKKNSVLLTTSFNNMQTLAFAFVPSIISTTTTSRASEEKLDRNSPVRVHERYLLKPFNLNLTFLFCKIWLPRLTAVKKATVGFVLNLVVSLLLTGTTNENLWNSREVSAFRLNRRILVIVINEPDTPLIRCLKQTKVSLFRV